MVALVGCRGSPAGGGQVGPDAGSAPAALTSFACGAEFPAHARCGDYEVFEDRQSGRGRALKLRWVVLPATGPGARAADPLFVLAGGPGQAATALVGLADSQLRGVNQRRDLVFVDQRGTGMSNGLRCTAAALPDMIVGLTAPSQRATLDGCRAGWAADLRHYGTTTAMADLDELREALGYGQINLWGVSYGTRAALEYVRRHEASVRSVSLWGVAPPQLPYPSVFSAASDAALDQLLSACAADRACQMTLPEGRATLDAIVARLDAEPATIELLDPRSGQLHAVEVDRQLFMTGVRLALYDTRWSSALPGMLAAAGEGELGPLMRFVVDFVLQVYSGVDVGMHLAITCSEDAARLGPADLERAAASVFGARSLEELVEVCADWPALPLPADWAEPVRSEVPVLLMSGAADPATPPSSARAAAATLTRARVVEFPNVAHGTATATPCVSRLVRAFLDQPDPRALDVSCARDSSRPPFELRPLD